MRILLVEGFIISNCHNKIGNASRSNCMIIYYFNYDTGHLGEDMESQKIPFRLHMG